ncbi:hypothetical protein M8J76_016583 [Diaphorina citri]|nr:hypothetical protein M8J75_000461 [Diaphorina citri]KAI5750550.1 hypothetical protein M8J76_016583 [Diaphorina citri]KAI5754496.1 hypothetical protein M8J77_009018 [Diaphorina citri]
MVIWSSIQKAGTASLSILCRNAQLVRGLKTSTVKYSGGHDNHFSIKPSQWQWDKFKDFFHFYVMIGGLPCLAIIFVSNVFIGPATLTEIPEGYTPQHWEYHKHPITRFIAKTCHTSPQEIYEKKMDRLYELDEIRKIQKVTNKIDKLMGERNDQQVYYYKPVHTNHFTSREKEAEEFRDVVSGSTS